MENVYIFILGVLVLAAVIDLIVGVSNDAVNFLLPAIGSKASSVKIIMLIAVVGIIIGALFSNGMMEVARKGIFQPDMFSFNDVMLIFLGIMLTDIILLDFFNSLGLPTSTTVSMIFGLLGSSVGVAVMIIADSDQPHQLYEYINSAKALTIIAGILFSVIVAFTIGAIVQYFSRLLFSFDYSKSYKRFGALWGSIAITAITYFVLVKGLKGSTFAVKGSLFYDLIHNHISSIIFLSFAAWAVILAILQFLFKVNILKFIVLSGTFALALAFAGNDLVNFIGVPLAGVSSFQEWQAAGMPESGMMMGVLKEPVKTPTLFLMIAGVIMVLALWFSKKSKTVTKTSLDLSRQDEGAERFESNAVARAIVRMSVMISKAFDHISPNAFKSFAQKRFDTSVLKKTKNEKSNFDLIRAGVNLMVAGILIAIGTSYKLPLSTTYVTFMVAMGSSLSDRAWGRESAVYRVSGVITVIGGWFVTAFVAFMVAFIFGILMYIGGVYAISGILLLAAFTFYKSKIAHKKRIEKDTDLTVQNIKLPVHKQCSFNIIDILSSTSDIYARTFAYFKKEKRNKLKQTYTDQKLLSKKSKELKDNVYLTIDSFSETSIDQAPFYVQVLDYLREITHALHFIVKPVFDYIDNNHKPLTENQYNELEIMADKLVKLLNTITDSVKKEKFVELNFILEKQKELIDFIDKSRINQIKRIKNKTVGTKNSILYMNLLAETKNIALYSVNLFKSERDFQTKHKPEY
jgi:phosphate/sulfate permease